jgi:hypothetical protein
LRHEAGDEIAKRGPQVLAAEDDGMLRDGDDRVDRFGNLVHQGLRGRRIQDQTIAAFLAGRHGLGQSLLQPGIQRYDRQGALGILEGTHQRAAERLTTPLDERVEIFDRWRVVGEHLQDGDHVAHGDLFGEQLTQNLLHAADRHHIGNQLLDDGRVRRLHLIDQDLRVLAGEQFMGVAADDLGQMGADHGRGLDDGESAHLGFRALLFRDPDGRQTEHGLGGADPDHLLIAQRRTHGEQAAHHELAAGDLLAANLDAVCLGSQLDVVADANGRHDEAQLARDLSPGLCHPLQQVAAGLFVSQRYEPEADLDFHRIDV